jgi:hypothetical protein
MFDRIEPQKTVVPDEFRKKAEAEGQNRLKDDSMVKVMQNALQQQGASATEMQAQPSDLAWRG